MNPDDPDPARDEDPDDRPAEEHGTSHLVRKESVGGAVGAAVGSVTGAAAGAALGAIGGPAGVAGGAVVGAVAGGLGGKAAGEGAKPDLEVEKAPGEQPRPSDQASAPVDGKD